MPPRKCPCARARTNGIQLKSVIAAPKVVPRADDRVLAMGRLVARCSPGRTPSLRLQGHLDHRNAVRFQTFVEQRCHAVTGQVEIDIRGLKSIDLFGLSVLICIGEYLRARGGRLRLRCSQSVAHRLLDVGKALDVLGDEIGI